MSKYPNNYFYKILLFGVILSSFPIFLVGFFTYSKYFNEIQEKSKISVQDHLVRNQNRVEQVLRTTDHSLNYFVNSNFLLQTLSEPLHAEQFQLLRQIKQELNHLQTFDTGISDIILLSREQEWFIDNVGLHRLEAYRKADRLLPYFDLPIDSLWDVDIDPSEDPGYGQPCAGTAQLIKKLPSNAATKRGLAITQIPICHLAELISYDKEFESILVLDRNRNVFLQADPGKLLDAQVQAEVIHRIVQESPTSGQFQSKPDHRHFTVTYRKSDYNGWTYVSFISIDQLNKESRSIGWYTSMVCLILLLLTMAVAWIVSRKIYNPVKQLFHFSAKVFQAVDHDRPKDGFEYLTEQIKHVVDTNSMLHSRLQTQVEQLKDLFVVKLLGDQLSANEIADKLPMLGFDREWHSLSVITLQVDKLEGTKYRQSDMDLLLFAINNIVEELIDADRRLNPIVIDQSQVTIWLGKHGDPMELKADLYRLTKHIQSQINAYLKLHVSVGISLPYRELTKTRQAYQESLDALKNRLRLGDNAIIFYEELPQGGCPISTLFPPYIQNDLSDAIKLADRAQVDRLMTAFFHDLIDKKAGPLEYEMATARIVVDLMQLTQSVGIHYMPFMDKRSLFEQLFTMRSAQDIKDWLTATIIEPIIVTIEERLTAQYKGISEHIIAIIQAEYEQELSLDTLAARLHYNPSYMGRVFRKETGVPFSDYLAKFRHGKAVAYLLDTDMPIREIAEKLQFTNPQNFIRSFRKFEGVTPGQYREKSRTY